VALETLKEAGLRPRWDLEPHSAHPLEDSTPTRDDLGIQTNPRSRRLHEWVKDWSGRLRDILVMTYELEGFTDRLFTHLPWSLANIVLTVGGQQMASAFSGLASVMMREMLTMVDLGALLADPVFYGIGVPRGDGKLVVVIPGLLGNDLYLQPLRRWLGCVGYSPVRSTLDFNAGCMQRLRGQIHQQIMRRMEVDPRPIALIGHSRGGVMAWALASQLQENVSHLVLLGSPVASFRASVASGNPYAPAGAVGRILMRISEQLREILDPDCNYPNCGCALVNDVMGHLSARTAILSIHGSEDLVVEETAQSISDGQNVLVNASHVGLVYNAQVYRALGDFLARRATSQAC
jgi:alpha/beta hydrolase family protein